MRPRFLILFCACLLLACGGAMARDAATPAKPATTFMRWDSSANRVDADFDGAPLTTVLDHIARETGWEVAYEPGMANTVSARFKQVPRERALSMLFPSLSYTVLPQSNAVPRLLVFKTSQANATRLLPRTQRAPTGRIDNELIVKVKPGTDIDALARQLGARVVGRDDVLGVYRLQFDDPESAASGAEMLAQHPDVEGIDYNYWVERPVLPEGTPVAGSSGGFDMDFQAPENGGCNVIVGVIDTPYRPFQDNRDNFILPAISLKDAAEVTSSLTPTHQNSMIGIALNTLAANSKEATSSVQFLPVDVYGNAEVTTTYDVARGVATAVSQGANIINLSLGTSGNSAFLHQVIQQAVNQGVVVFAAAGNTPTTANVYPAAYAEVTAVTAGSRGGNIASYANHGSFVDAVAPGSAVVNWNNRNYIVSGTSAASAHVSGLAASQANPCDPSFSTLGQRISATLAPK